MQIHQSLTPLADLPSLASKPRLCTAPTSKPETILISKQPNRPNTKTPNERLSEANPPGSVSKRLDAVTLARLLTDLGTSLNISNKDETLGVRDFELRQRGSVEGRRGAR